MKNQKNVLSQEVFFWKKINNCIRFEELHDFVLNFEKTYNCKIIFPYNMKNHQEDSDIETLSDDYIKSMFVAKFNTFRYCRGHIK